MSVARRCRVTADAPPMGRPLPLLGEPSTSAGAPGLQMLRRGLVVDAAVRCVRGVQLTAALTREDEWYVARCLDVEVTSQGHTVEEALANLREALELYFEGAELPEELEPPIIATIRIPA